MTNPKNTAPPEGPALRSEVALVVEDMAEVQSLLGTKGMLDASFISKWRDTLSAALAGVPEAGDARPGGAPAHSDRMSELLGKALDQDEELIAKLKAERDEYKARFNEALERWHCVCAERDTLQQQVQALESTPAPLTLPYYNEACAECGRAAHAHHEGDPHKFVMSTENHEAATPLPEQIADLRQRVKSLEMQLRMERKSEE